MDKMKFEVACKAKELAKRVHYGQTDIGGTDLFSGHLTNVVEKLKKVTDEDYIYAVGWLHDVLEDSTLTDRDLLKELFPLEVIAAVKAITKNEDEPYDDYLKRVKANDLARIVKIADLTHNSDLTRLNRIPKARDLNRLEKYQSSIEFLKEELND